MSASHAQVEAPPPAAAAPPLPSTHRSREAVLGGLSHAMGRVERMPALAPDSMLPDLVRALHVVITAENDPE